MKLIHVPYVQYSRQRLSKLISRSKATTLQAKVASEHTSLGEASSIVATQSSHNGTDPVSRSFVNWEAIGVRTLYYCFSEALPFTSDIRRE